MTISWITAAWFLPFVLPIVVWVSWSDLASMKIPNKAVLALLGVFAIIGLLALPTFTEYLWRWSHFAVVLVVGFVLATFGGGVGAGDAKFAAAMAPFIALSDAMTFLYLLGATTIAAFALHRFARAKLRHHFPDWESWTHRAFPMGFALAPALLFYLLIGLFAA